VIIAGETKVADAEGSINCHDPGGPPLILLPFDSTKVHIKHKLKSYTMALTGSCLCGAVHYTAEGSLIGHRDSIYLGLIA
jgi:Uncharacterized conserved protein